MKMKDKKAGQADRKQQHKERLQAAKRRREAPNLEVPQPDRSEREVILIVCGGKNTEPSYLRQFRLSNARIILIGEGYDPMSLVERAVQEKDTGAYDQVWTVFDKDDFDNFDNAVFKAEAKQLGVAYSNQAFEYWLILHFEDHQGGGMHRNDYHDKLNGYLQPFGLYYDGRGNKLVTKEIFETLLATDPAGKTPRIHLAISRAKRIYEQRPHRSPAEEESSTTVFRLVEELLKFAL